jgi:hypothetical protein
MQGGPPPLIHRRDHRRACGERSRYVARLFSSFFERSVEQRLCDLRRTAAAQSTGALRELERSAVLSCGKVSCRLRRTWWRRCAGANGPTRLLSSGWRPTLIAWTPIQAGHCNEHPKLDAQPRTRTIASPNNSQAQCNGVCRSQATELGSPSIVFTRLEMTDTSPLLKRSHGRETLRLRECSRPRESAEWGLYVLAHTCSVVTPNPSTASSGRHRT